MQSNPLGWPPSHALAFPIALEGSGCDKSNNLYSPQQDGRGQPPHKTTANGSFQYSW
jgi:hypothetical protein